jgi:hypothetical protein
MLERDLHFGPICDNVSLLDLHVKVRDLGDAKIAKRCRGRSNGRTSRLFPGCGAGTNEFHDFVDRQHGSFLVLRKNLRVATLLMREEVDQLMTQPARPEIHNLCPHFGP